jgi:hypothetical protein
VHHFDEKDHGNIVFEEGGFSIRIGYSNYFISHDECPIPTQDKYSVAYDTYFSGDVAVRDACDECKKRYSTEMGGFITLLNWEK